MNQEIFKLEQGEDNDRKRNLLKAAKELNKIAYNRFKKSYVRSEEKLLKSTKIDEYGNTYTCITSVDYPHAKPRIFYSTFNRYICIISVAHESQYKHKIKIRGCYESTYFEL